MIKERPSCLYRFYALVLYEFEKTRKRERKKESERSDRKQEKLFFLQNPLKPEVVAKCFQCTWYRSRGERAPSFSTCRSLCKSDGKSQYSR